MLRYYEQAGLIQSIRNDENAYRFYDETALKQLNSIIILRKLRVSVKQIKEILDNQNAQTAVAIFERNISELDEEITSLATIKSILARFVEELRAQTGMTLQLDLLNAANSISFSKNLIKEKVSMEDLNKASEKYPKLTNVRIVYLPPAVIAVTKSFTVNHEWDAYAEIAKFAEENDLLKIKPDARTFGFNMSSNGVAGYEAWATIPDDMEVPAPFEKRNFNGGLYACHARAFKDLNMDECKFIHEWVRNSEEFDYDNREPIGMYGTIEEQYKLSPYVFNNPNIGGLLHIDFLIPIKPK